MRPLLIEDKRNKASRAGYWNKKLKDMVTWPHWKPHHRMRIKTASENLRTPSAKRQFYRMWFDRYVLLFNVDVKELT